MSICFNTTGIIYDDDDTTKWVGDWVLSELELD